MTIDDAKKFLGTYDGPDVRIMEVCGTHTHEIFRQGIRSLLSEKIDLISGPGCPVCVTPADYIDEPVYLAKEKGVTVCTFGDLVRVPGSEGSIADARAQGGRVRIVYSPMDALGYAAAHPEEDVVFLSVGFETTTPGACTAVQNAVKEEIRNFSLLTANKTMPQAYRALKGSADAFLYPGHVHAILGTGICRELTGEGISGVIAGFTARELITAIYMILIKLGTGEPFFENAYPRVVTDEGSPSGRALIDKYMEPCDSIWRGIGGIRGSGLKLRSRYEPFDARIRYGIPEIKGRDHPGCCCAKVLRGEIRPPRCPLFGKACSPQDPKGACMVSSEGACAAYYQYGGLL